MSSPAESSAAVHGAHSLIQPLSVWTTVQAPVSLVHGLFVLWIAFLQPETMLDPYDCEYSVSQCVTLKGLPVTCLREMEEGDSQCLFEACKQRTPSQHFHCCFENSVLKCRMCREKGPSHRHHGEQTLQTNTPVRRPREMRETPEHPAAPWTSL